MSCLSACVIVHTGNTYSCTSMSAHFHICIHARACLYTWRRVHLRTCAHAYMHTPNTLTDTHTHTSSQTDIFIHACAYCLGVITGPAGAIGGHVWCGTLVVNTHWSSTGVCGKSGWPCFVLTNTKATSQVTQWRECMCVRVIASSLTVLYKTH